MTTKQPRFEAPLTRVAATNFATSSAGAVIAKGGPLLHEPAPFLKHVAAPVGRLHPVRERVRQGLLGDFARVGGGLGAPVAEARAQAVHREVAAPHPPQQHVH